MPRRRHSRLPRRTGRTVMTIAANASTLRDEIAARLITARERTRGLTDSVEETALTRQHSPLMSPWVWHRALVATKQDLGLPRSVGGREPMHPKTDPLYDAFEPPRAKRPPLPLLPPAEARGYASDVRGRVLDLLERVSFTTGPLVDRGFVFGMIAQHEQQHDETMLATHQLRDGRPVLAAPPPRPAPADVLRLPAEVLVPGGRFTMGTTSEPWALDNERPAHVIDLPPFYLDTAPVTNAAYAGFIADDGYLDQRLWSPAGWQHRQKAGLTAPLFWEQGGAGQWLRRRFGVTEPVPPAEPVMHGCWYEADAYARWAGRRLPTAAGSANATRYDPVTGPSRPYPSGCADPAPGQAHL